MTQRRHTELHTNSVDKWLFRAGVSLVPDHVEEVTQRNVGD